MQISEFQKLIKDVYGKKDAQRGVDKTFVWFIEEVGELARALHRQDRQAMAEEFADCLAWLSTLASLSGIGLEEEAIAKYGHGCSRCHATPCRCHEPGV
jgi:NTP pyrophosphatase (non-canonical NTP hydrolase)